MSDGAARVLEFPSPLLGPDDPPAYEVVNAGAAGRVVFICDHASNAVPRALDMLGLDEAVLGRHLAWDIGAADVARRMAARADAALVLSGYSRLVIDCNRALDDPTSIPVISDGVVVPGNRGITPAHRAARAETFFHPYHDAVSRALAAVRARGQVPVFVSVHSFTPVFKGFERPWHVGILWNRDPRIARPVLAALAADPSLVLGDNQPYSARDRYGYSVETHAEAAGLPHVLIEIRQDLIDTRHGAEAWSARIGAALETALANAADLDRAEGPQV